MDDRVDVGTKRRASRLRPSTTSPPAEEHAASVTENSTTLSTIPSSSLASKSNSGFDVVLITTGGQVAIEGMGRLR